MTYTPDTYSDFKASVKFTTTANITLSGVATQAGGDWSASLTAGDRILVKNQTTGAQNGIYVAAAGAWTRALDADQSLEITSGMMVTVESGTTLADTTWIVTNDGAITIGSTALTFSQVGRIPALGELSNVDTTGVVDGALLRYESSLSTWQDSTGMLLLDSGGLQLTSGAGITMAGDANLRRFVAGTIGTDGVFRAEGGLESNSKTYLNAAQRVDFVEKTSNYTATLNGDFAILGNTSAGSFTITLPASATAGDTYLIKRLGANNLNIGANGGALIDGVAAPKILSTDGEAYRFISNGTNWFTFSVSGGGGASTLDGLTDVDTTGVVDGALLRYESTGTVWNDTANLLLSDAGQLQVTTTGASAGILLGGDAQLYRGAPDVISVGSGDKIQQNAAPTAADDLTNKTYVDNQDLVYSRRSWFGL